MELDYRKMNWEVFDKETLLEIVKKFSENVHESINTINYLKLEVTSDIYQQFSTKSPPSCIFHCYIENINSK